MIWKKKTKLNFLTWKIQWMVFWVSQDHPHVGWLTRRAHRAHCLWGSVIRAVVYYSATTHSRTSREKSHIRWCLEKFRHRLPGAFRSWPGSIRRPGVLLGHTVISENATWDPWASEDQWKGERRIYVLAFFCFLSKWAAQHLPVLWVAFPSLPGKLLGSQISYPMVCTPSDPRNGHRSQSLCERLGHTGMSGPHTGMSGPHPGQDEIEGGGKWPGLLTEQVAKAWGASEAQWVMEIHKFVWCTPLELVQPQAIISSFPTVLKNETTISNMRVSWTLFWIKLICLPGVTWQVTISEISP